MKQKGINLATVEFEQNMADVINECSLPASTIRLVLAKLISEISSIETRYVEQERIEFEKENDEEEDKGQ